MNETGTATPAPLQPAPSAASAMIGILTEPGATFRALAARPTWACLVPLIILLVLGAVGGYLFTERADMEQIIRDQIRKSPRAAELTQQQMEESVQSGLKVVQFTKYVNFVFALAFILVISLVYWVVLMIFGASLSFPNAFRVICWSQTPKILSALLFLVILFVRDPSLLDPQNPVMTNLGAILGRERLGAPLYAVLSDLDLFSLWTLWLYATGFAAFAQAKIARTAAAVFLVYGLYMAGHAALAAMF